MTKSVLDDIPGLGEKRKQRLVKEMGGIRAVQRAQQDDLRALPWLPDSVADAIFEKTHEAEVTR